MTPNNKTQSPVIARLDCDSNLCWQSVFLSSGLAFAQEDEAPEDPQPITEEIAAELELRRDRVIEQRKQITRARETYRHD